MAHFASNSEMQFLVRCLPRISGGADEAPRIDPTLDWKKLVFLAGHHGFLPLLSLRLTQAEWTSVPTDYRKALQVFQLKNTQRCLAWSVALTEIQDSCRNQGLPVMTWKGPLLALELYGAVTLREFADLDFLVRQEDLATAIKLLEDLSYSRLQQGRDESVSRRLRHRDQEFCFVRPADGIYVELHTQLMPSRFSGWQDAEDYFRNVQWRPRVRSWVLRLPPEKLLISLCGHGLKHHWERLKWLADIALLVEKYQDVIDWDALIDATAQADKLEVVLHSLWLASNIFSFALPLAIIKAAHGRNSILELTQETAARIMSGQIQQSDDTETDQELALFFPSTTARLLFMLRRMLEPVGRTVILSKFRRMLRFDGI